MKIETKYDLGDKFYKMEDNRPTEFEVTGITIKANDGCSDAWYNLHYTDRYTKATRTGVREDVLATGYYRTKSALMLAVFPDLFKEVKNAWVLNEEGGEQ